MSTEARESFDYSQKGIGSIEVIKLPGIYQSIHFERNHWSELVNFQSQTTAALSDAVRGLEASKHAVDLQALANIELSTEIQRLIHQQQEYERFRKELSSGKAKPVTSIWRKTLVEMASARTFTKLAMAATVGVTAGMALLTIFPSADKAAAGAAVALSSMIAVALNFATHSADLHESNLP